MKTMKKFVSLALALMMALALMAPAFAEEGGGAAEVKKGSITISNAAVGETYKLVKLFDATFNEDKTAYAYTGDIPTDLADYFVKDEAGYISATDAAKGEGDTLSSAAVNAIKDWAAGQEPLQTKENVQTNTVRFDNLDYGYYVVISRNEVTGEDGSVSGGAVSVTTTDPDPVIVDKNTGNEITTPVKTVKDAAGNVIQTAAVGDTVTYTVEFTTVNWDGDGENAKQVKEYKVSDTLPAFLSNATVTEIKVGDTAIEAKQFTNKELVIAWADKTDNLTCKDTEHTHTDACYEWTSKYNNGVTLKITYTATVNGNITEAGDDNHKNTVTVTPVHVDSTDGTPKTDDEDLYTVIIDINKYTGDDKEDSTKKLAGAKFVLQNSEGKYYKWVEAVGETPATVQWVDSVDNADVRTTDENGAIEPFNGLNAGVEYKLIETEAPAGYNKLDKPITFTIEIPKDSENKVVDLTENISHTQDVENSTGALLPSTGGIGTTIFYVVGGVLVVGAAILLMTRKRVRDEE